MVILTVHIQRGNVSNEFKGEESFMKFPKKISSRKHAKEFDPHFESVFKNLLQYNEVDDYDAVRPLYTQAKRLFFYGLHQSKATNPSFKLKLRSFVELQLLEIEDGMVFQDDPDEIKEMFLTDNNIPRWIRVAVEPWIDEGIKLIDQQMTSFGRPEYWELLRGDFGKIAARKYCVLTVRIKRGKY
jgi:hypothetical protein